MSKIILYHGSSKKIERPIYGKGKIYNDYGQGFYCTKHIELAKEWACNEGVDGLAVEYDRLAVFAVSVFHLSHWRLDTLTNYLLAV